MVLKIEEIKAKFPNEWVLLGDPVIKNTQAVEGVIIMHSKEKRDIALANVNWKDDFKTATTIFTGDIIKNRKFWL